MSTYSELAKKYKELGKEAGKYNKPEYDEVYKLISELVKGRRDVGDNGDLAFPLVTGDIIDEALNKTGYSRNKAFVSDFKKYREIEQEAREVQLQGLLLSDSPIGKALQAQLKEEPNTDSWQFRSIKIVVPISMQKIMDNLLERDLKDGKGLYKNITEIPIEDEDEDDFLLIEAYGIKCSLEPYYRELQRYEVTNIALLSEKKPRGIFLSILKMLVMFIKDNTAAPNKVRNKITDTLKVLDKVPVIGLIWQILLLQGLSRWIKDAHIESGLNEAQELYNWICMQLIKKEIRFCYFPWGKEDRERLKPLCNYLYSTEVGKMVQKKLFKDKQPQENKNPSTSTPQLPKELDTEKGRELLQRAINAGFLSETYKWIGSTKGLLAYFTERASEYLSLGKGIYDSKPKISWKPFEILFNEKNLSISKKIIKE